MGDGVGSKMLKTMNPSFFWVENHESFGGFPIFEPKKCFRVLAPWGLYGVEWDERFYAVYAVFSHFCYVGGLGAVIPCAHSKGCKWGCCNSIYLLGSERMFFVVYSHAEGQSKPVPKTRNDCCQQ